MPRKRKKGYDRSVYRSFTLVMQFGINMLVPICMMSAIGVFLDQKLGTSFIMVILFFAGAAAGGQNIFRMAKQIYEAPDEDGKKTTTVKKESDSGNEDCGSIEKGK